MEDRSLASIPLAHRCKKEGKSILVSPLCGIYFLEQELLMQEDGGGLGQKSPAAGCHTETPVLARRYST
jgi:hypothetical protein